MVVQKVRGIGLVSLSVSVQVCTCFCTAICRHIDALHGVGLHGRFDMSQGESRSGAVLFSLSERWWSAFRGERRRDRCELDDCVRVLASPGTRKCPGETSQARRVGHPSRPETRQLLLARPRTCRLRDDCVDWCRLHCPGGVASPPDDCLSSPVVG